jgi:hypothetical protein
MGFCRYLKVRDQPINVNLSFKAVYSNMPCLDKDVTFKVFFDIILLAGRKYFLFDWRLSLSVTLQINVNNL